MDIRKYLETAIRAAYDAGLEILDVYTSSFEVSTKEDNTPLTAADRRAHAVIAEALKTTGLPVLSEEGKEIPYKDRKDWELFWMVDPLDGTKEFVKRNGEFTVNIALISEGSPIAGVIYVPVNGTLYFGELDMGSFKIANFNGTSGDMDEWTQKALALPVDEEPRPYTVVGSRSHLSNETRAFFEDLKQRHGEIQVVTMGSSLKICLVAEGVADIYPRFAPTMEWDTAAGHAIAAACGKEITDFETKKPLRYNKENLLNNWFVVA